jgi:hypothetical protein
LCELSVLPSQTDSDVEILGIEVENATGRSLGFRNHLDMIIWTTRKGILPCLRIR